MDKRFTRPKQLLPAAVALGLAALALAGWYLTRQPPDTATLVLFGNIDIRQVSLAFNGSERIAEMRVQEGDRVEAGQRMESLRLTENDLHCLLIKSRDQVLMPAPQQYEFKLDDKILLWGTLHNLRKISKYL